MAEKIDNPIIITNERGNVIDPTGGFETEYGYSAVKRFSDHSWEIAAEDLLGMTQEGHFYDDGSRRYVDHTHPEFSTAEEIDYMHAAYRALIGHIIMAKMCKEGAKRHPDLDLHLYANVTDGKGKTWAAHQSMLAPRDLLPEVYIPALGAHNMSRIVWSGAGMVEADRSPRGFRYVLSERANFIEKLSSLPTTEQRGLVNMRDEPHALWSKYRRIHDISGESVFSPRVMALKLAAAAMILRACGVGERYDDLLPTDAPSGMRIISRDPTLKAKIETPRGRYTGVEHQMLIFERTIGAIATRYMTPQDIVLADIWEQSIEMLTDDPMSDESVAQHDWAKKWSIIQHALDRPGRKLSDSATAKMIWLNYGQLLPKYGLGMTAVMNGEFTDSPPRELLEEVENGGLGLPPPDTRARLRGDVIARLNRSRMPFKADWEKIELKDTWRLGDLLPLFAMNDPFASENTTVEAGLRDLGVRQL